MKTTPQAPSNRSKNGSVLMISLLTLAIVAMGLAGYLVIIANQNRSVMQSLQWNSAIPISEAGIEEALAQLNSRSASPGLRFTQPWL